MASLQLSILSLFTTATTLLCGELADHFKKNTKDGSDHSMRNVDFIYIINLDQRPEKWETCIKQMNPYGIFPFRFSAVNGWELSLEDINDVGLKYSVEMDGQKLGTSYFLNDKFRMTHEFIKNVGQTYFAHCMSRGAIGIVMSHLSVLQDAYDSGYDTIWVMEDDVEVLRDPTIISSLVDKLDKQVGKGNWDILFTDKDIRDAKWDPRPVCLDPLAARLLTPAKPQQFFVKSDDQRRFSQNWSEVWGDIDDRSQERHDKDFAVF